MHKLYHWFDRLTDNKLENYNILNINQFFSLSEVIDIQIVIAVNNKTIHSFLL